MRLAPLCAIDLTLTLQLSIEISDPCDGICVCVHVCVLFTCVFTLMFAFVVLYAMCILASYPGPHAERRRGPGKIPVCAELSSIDFG